MNGFLLLGFLGTVLYLANHAYVSLSPRVSEQVYFGGNLIAALCVAASSLSLSSWQAVVTNLFWAVVSIQRLRGGDFRGARMTAAAIRPLFVAALVAVLVALIIEPSTTFSVLAWISVVLFVVAYLLFAARRLGKRTYLWLNSIAAVAIVPQLWVDKNTPVLVLEVAWAILSVYGALSRRPEPHVVD